MSLPSLDGMRPPFAIVVGGLCSSAAGMAAAVTAGDAAVSGTAAAAAALILVMSGLATNLTVWRQSKAAEHPIDATAALLTTTHLTMLTYAWGSLALFAIYVGTPLRWQHGWQYAIVMALIAAGHVIYIRHLSSTSDAGPATRRAVALAALQGAGAITALAWLVASGKLATTKGDWAANQVFLAGGVAVASLSAIIVITHRILSARGLQRYD